MGSKSHTDVDERKIMFLTRSFNRGGAERQLNLLAIGLRRSGWQVTVACFYPGGPFQRDLEQAGVPVIDLAKRGRWDLVAFLWRFMRTLRKERPAMVYGFLPVPNLVATLVKFCCPKARLVWGVRASNVALSRYGRMERLVYWLERRCARRADLVIANSEAGACLRVSQGFPARTMRVIPNGIDTGRFHFDPAGRQRVRAEWGVDENERLVGLVARLDPMKDHPTFLRAASLLVQRDSRWRFVCVGAGPPDYASKMHGLCRQLALDGRVIWAGARDDMVAVFSALDIASSSSFGEGFSNTVAEAMACERPCVVTDVGDSALIVADLGVVVPPAQPSALADGIDRVWACNQEAGENFAAALRQRIVDQYAAESLAERTACVLETLRVTCNISRTMM